MIRRLGAKFLVTIFLITFCSIPSCSQLLSNRISLHIISEKNTYVTGELASLDLVVKNLINDSTRITLPTTADYLLRVFVRGKNGDSLLVGSRCNWEQIPTVTLPPSDSLMQVVGLWVYANPGSKTGSIPDIPPGRYEVWALLDGVQSNTITIEFVDRSDSEIEVARRLSVFSERNSYPPPETSKLYDILRNFPNSVYRPNVYFELIVRSIPHDSSSWQETVMETKQIALEAAHEMPNSWVMELAMNRVYSSYSRYPRDKMYRVELKEQIEKEFRQLSAKFPNTRLERIIYGRLHPLTRTKAICSWFSE